MNLLIVTPIPKESTRGNRITATRWATILNNLGHTTSVAEQFVPKSTDQDADLFDGLIALHATRSADSILNFRRCHRDKPIIVCLTGTDLHADLQNQRGPEICELAYQSLRIADRILLLEPEGGRMLTDEYQSNLATIFQSANAVDVVPQKKTDCFEVAVIGHLRPEKDPFRTAMATRLLPNESKIHVIHLGNALSSEMSDRAIQESQSNERYDWLGGLSHAETQMCLARSRLMVMSSRIEGAPGVLSEAIVNNVPVLAARIPASIGMLGAEYPGLYTVENTNQLAELLKRAESDHEFYAQLKYAVAELKPRYSLEHETHSWRLLLESVFGR